MSNAKAAMEKMEVMINGVKLLVDTLTSEAAAQKEANERMEARLTALEKLFQKEKPKAAAKKTKASAKTEEESESEEKKEKAKREVKPSAKSDAWRALCDAVRAVHKKDAMKIAKILKDGGNLEPTKEQIEAAAAELPQKESTPTQSDTEKPAKSGSESDGSKSVASSAAKKRGRPKKTASE